MKRYSLVYLLVLAIMSVTKPAYAYTDPGVGGVLYQIVIIVLSGIGLFAISLKTKLFEIFRKDKK